MGILPRLKRFLRLTPRYDPSLTIRDIAYFSGSDAHVNHKLNIFLPTLPNDADLPSPEANTDQKHIPVIVHVHGGGWVRGNRTSERRGGPTVGRTCARHGYVGVVISYRLARISVVSFLAWSLIFGLIIIIIGLALLSWQLITGYFVFMIAMYAYHFLRRVRSPVNIEHMIDDICLALVYIRDHIHEHCPQADPNQLFLSGHSAGAHLISLLALDKSHFLRHDFPPASIRGLIVMSGIYSLSNPAHDSANNIRNWVFRILYSSNLLYPKGKTKKDYSPIEYIRSAGGKEGEEQQQLPPFLVMSARFDMGLEVDAKRFVDRLSACQHRVDYFVVGGMTTHGSIASNFSKNDAHRRFLQFVGQHRRY